MRRRGLLLGPLLALAPPAIADASDVRVSSVGYLPSGNKRATIAVSGTQFAVKRAKDGSLALSGALSPAAYDDDTSEIVSVADFSALTEEGSFYLEVGTARSSVFPIAKNAPYEPLRVAMLGFYGWRCNTAVSIRYAGTTFAHDACHMDDAHTDYTGGPGRRDGTKGWHDAGDYGKYVTNVGVTVGAMLAAWEQFPAALAKVVLPIPDADPAIPDYLQEIRWELEWLLTMPYGVDDGRVSHKLTAYEFDPPEGWGMPEKDTQTRFFVPYSTQATAQLVGTLAKAARVYAPYDAAFAARCLSAAKVSYAWLGTSPGVHNPSQNAFHTGTYVSFDAGDRIWAAAEMWETTGDAGALSDFENKIAEPKVVPVSASFDWYDLTTLGSLVYVRSKRVGRDPTVVATVHDALLSVADAFVKTAGANGYGRALVGKAGYGWGSNGLLARTCTILETAREITGKAEYHDTCLDQLAWLFGRNTYDRSFVTGVGKDPPMHPHHRPSANDGIAPPWPGLLVGGGGDSGTGWIDDEGNYTVNEVAINWNAALVYALAASLDADSMPSLPRPDAGADARFDAPNALPEETSTIDLAGYTPSGGCSVGATHPARWWWSLAPCVGLAFRRRRRT
jgi:endoglucanase